MAKHRVNGRQNEDFDDFHESVSPAMSSEYRRTSERDVNITAARSVVEQLISTIASILSALLVVRFITHLFSNDQANGFVNFINAATNWMAQPFQALFQNVPAGVSGFFDFPAIAAMLMILALAYLLNRLLATTRREDTF